MVAGCSSNAEQKGTLVPRNEDIRPYAGQVVRGSLGASPTCPAMRPVLTFCSVLMLFTAGCDTAPSTPRSDSVFQIDAAEGTVTATPDGWHVTGASSIALTTNAPRLDVRFRPLDLEPGESFDAGTGDLRLQSTYVEPKRHDVTLQSAGRSVLRVIGLLDGIAQRTFDLGGAAGDFPGGSTSLGPTSVHRGRVCNPRGCHETIEYDYDLTAPDGNGAASWTYEDVPIGLVDRVRFEVADAAGSIGLVELSGPGHISILR